MPWSVSLFEHARSNRPVNQLRDLDKLRVLLTTWRPGITSKQQLPAWSPTFYLPGKTRAKTNVYEVSCLVFDLDDGMPVEAAVEIFSGTGHTFLLHTSWSHSTTCSKFRLVFPLWLPVPGLQWDRGWRAAMSWWSDVAGDEWQPDPACSDASRLYYLPAYRAAQSCRQTHAVRGTFLDLDWQAQPVEAPLPVVPDRPQLQYVSGNAVDRETRRRLRGDAAARRALGRALGGAVGDDLVRHVRCPQCGRADVWWAVRPERRATASCNHKNSCGWFGHLDELALALGVQP